MAVSLPPAEEVEESDADEFDDDEDGSVEGLSFFTAAEAMDRPVGPIMTAEDRALWDRFERADKAVCSRVFETYMRDSVARGFARDPKPLAYMPASLPAKEADMGKTDDLTDRERTLLEKYREHIAKHGSPPSRIELGRLAGLPAKNAASLQTCVYQSTRRLVQRGLMPPGRSGPKTGVPDEPESGGEKGLPAFVLEVLGAYRAIKAKGGAPAQRAIADVLGWEGTAGAKRVFRAMKKLRRRGLVHELAPGAEEQEPKVAKKAPTRSRPPRIPKSAPVAKLVLNGHAPRARKPPPLVESRSDRRGADREARRALGKDLGDRHGDRRSGGQLT